MPASSRHWPDVGASIRAALASTSGLAIQAGEETLDWSGLADRIARIDADLSRAGIATGAVVAVPGRNDIDCAVAFLALIASGRTAAIVNPFQSGPAILASTRAYSPDALLLPEGDSAVAEAALNGPPLLLMASNGGITRLDGKAGSNASDSDQRDAAFICPTSGTTGDPKLITITRGTLARAMVEIATFNAGFGDRPGIDGGWPPLLQYSPLAHIGGVLTLLRGAVQGRAVVLIDRFEPHGWADLVERFRLRTTGLPPAMMRMVLEARIAPARLASLISIWSGTAPVRAGDSDAFSRRYGLPVLGNYGATEFCGAIATWSLDDHSQFHAERRGAVGRVDPQVATVRIRDGTGAIVSRGGEVGTLEVVVHRIGAQWMTTSDLASFDEEGFLYLHGRSDDAIIRGGFKLSPSKIAMALRDHHAVRDAVVIGVPDDRLGQVPVALVEVSPVTLLDEAELIAFARARLPAYFVPTAVRIVPALPRTATMKLDRRAIRALFDA